jgi:hypothetical protein
MGNDTDTLKEPSFIELMLELLGMGFFISGRLEHLSFCSQSFLALEPNRARYIVIFHISQYFERGKSRVLPPRLFK